MYKFSSFKEHYNLCLKLSIPIVLSQLGQVVVQIIDTAMVGRLGATELAAAAFASSTWFMIFIICMGVSMGITPLVGESYASRNHALSATYLQNGIVLFTLMGVVIFSLQWFTTPLLYHLGQPSQVVELAVPYYKMLVLSVVPFMIFAAFKQFLEGIGNTKVAMVVVITSNLINILGNYLFIYGNWGFPEMGVVGAGVSTLISRICMPIFVIFYFMRSHTFKRYTYFFSKNRFSLSKVFSLFKVGMPIALQIFMEFSAFALTSLMVGWIGTVELAANQVAANVSNFAFMAVLGVASATTIRVSHEYGARDFVAMKRAATASLHISFAWNTFTALLFILFREQIPLIFTTDPVVIEIASKLLIFVAIYQFSDGLQCMTIGILRGIRDVKQIMAIAFFSYIVVNLPIGYICAFKLHLGVYGLWIGIIVGLALASILLQYRYRKQLRRLMGELS